MHPAEKRTCRSSRARGVAGRKGEGEREWQLLTGNRNKNSSSSWQACKQREQQKLHKQLFSGIGKGGYGATQLPENSMHHEETWLPFCSTGYWLRAGAAVPAAEPKRRLSGWPRSPGQQWGVCSTLVPEVIPQFLRLNSKHVQNVGHPPGSRLGTRQPQWGKRGQDTVFTPPHLLDVNIFWGCTSTTSVLFQQQNTPQEVPELVPASH